MNDKEKQVKENKEKSKNKKIETNAIKNKPSKEINHIDWVYTGPFCG